MEWINKRNRVAVLKSLAMLLIVIMAVSLAGCGSGNPTASSAGREDNAGGNAEKKDYLNMSWEEIEEEAKKEGEVVFYSWHSEDLWKQVAEDFEKKYGIKMKVVIADNSLSQLLAEKDAAKSSADVYIVGGGPNVKTAMDAGLMLGPILPKMESKDQLSPALSEVQEGIPHNGYLVPLYRNQTGLLYNPEKVKNPPQTFDELVKWMEENPKQFGFSDPTKGGTGEAFIQTVISHVGGGLDKYKGDTELDPEKVKDWDKVWKWFNDRKDLYTVTASNADSLSRFNQHELTLTVAWDDSVLKAWKKGELFKESKLYIPDMGMPGGGDTVGISKNAEHKAAALLLINYLTSAETQKMMNGITGTYPARTDIQVENSALTAEEFNNKNVPWVPGPYKKHFDEEFVKNVLMSQ